MPTRTELTSDELNFLRSVFPGELLLSPEELLVYRSDASLIQGTPLACVCPENTDQVQKLMAWADEVRMPIYIRGRGTNLVGDCVAVQPGIIVSTSKMDHILEINNRDFVGIVEPGVNTARFQAACEAKGVYYPPDPATVKASSLGGNVVTCAGGMRAVKYGVTRDFVLGTEVILPGGEKVMFGGRAHKNVVGLDLAKLMVGSEGTLGFISKIFLKLLPKPESSATVMAGFASYKDALEAVGGIFGAGILPCALEFIGERIVKLMNKDALLSEPTLGTLKSSLSSLATMLFKHFARQVVVLVERALKLLANERQLKTKIVFVACTQILHQRRYRELVNVVEVAIAVNREVDHRKECVGVYILVTAYLAHRLVAKSQVYSETSKTLKQIVVVAYERYHLVACFVHFLLFHNAYNF